jgi:hypothetical protein
VSGGLRRAGSKWRRRPRFEWLGYALRVGELERERANDPLQKMFGAVQLVVLTELLQRSFYDALLPTLRYRDERGMMVPERDLPTCPPNSSTSKIS